MAIQHIFAKKEAANGTWLVPTRAYPMQSFEPKANQEYTDLRNTGSGYGLADSWRGAYLPSGSFEMFAYEEWLGTLLQLAGFNTITNTAEAGGTLAIGHGCIPQESAANLSGSVQAKLGASNAVSIRGLVIDKLTFGCKMKEPAMLKGEWIAKDIAQNGGTWGDGTSAPAVISSATYFGATVGLFHFAGAALKIGGTPALSTTTNQFSTTGGTTITTAEIAEMTLTNNYAWDHALGTERDPAILSRHDRTVEGKLDLNWSTIDMTHWAAMLAGTEQCLELAFTGSLIEASNYYKMIITLPKVTIRVADIPPIVGDQSKRVKTVNWKAQNHPSMVDSAGAAYDIGIKIIDQEATY